MLRREITMQALERTQPGLHWGSDIRTRHDYVRHGTLTVCALNYLEGKLITRLAARHLEWLVSQNIDERPGDLAYIIATITHISSAVTDGSIARRSHATATRG